MNTRFSYLYRDACNYKAFNQVVIKGECSDQDKRLINLALDGEFFIPEQIGLPLVRPSEEITIDDHCFAELDPENDINLTDEEPTVAITWSEIMNNFRAALKDGWDDMKYAVGSACDLLSLSYMS